MIKTRHEIGTSEIPTHQPNHVRYATAELGGRMASSDRIMKMGIEKRKGREMGFSVGVRRDRRESGQIPVIISEILIDIRNLIKHV